MMKPQTALQLNDQKNDYSLSKKGWMFFDLILKHYHPSDQTAIVTLLTPEEQQCCQTDCPPSKLSDWLNSATDILLTIHPQWIVDAIKSFEEKKQESILAALPPAVCTPVCELGKWTEPASHIRSDYVQPILKGLLSHLQDPTYLPLPAVPTGPLSPLLNLQPQQLIFIVEGMGLRDLAEIVRGTVDKKFLHSIYSCLNAQEQRLLRLYIQQKERLKTPPLVLKAWDGNKASLKSLYRERGLMRFARALYGQPSGFLWHLLHHFPPQEAKEIQKQMQQRAPQTTVSALLTQQLLGIIEFLQRQPT